MITQVPSSLIKSNDIKFQDYATMPQSKLKSADPEVLAKLLENEPKTGKCDVFVRSDVPENERVKISDGIYDKDAILEACRSSGEIGSAFTKIRVIASMKNIELYELLTGEKCPMSTPYEIDFNDWTTKLVLSYRALDATCDGGSIPTKEKIAEYYGNMAKRLDTAYSEGKFTKEEYDFINDGIMERMEHATSCAEETAARRKVGYDRSMSLYEFERSQAMTPEERIADFEAAIKECIRKYTHIDRNVMMQMFNSFRFGK